MARKTSVPADVREAIGTFMDKAQRNNELLAMTEAIESIRRIFPDLYVSDSDLIDAITSEAVVSNARLHIDTPRTGSSGSLERWDNEGGAIKKLPTSPERREAKRREVNDTDGTRRRDNDVRQRNRLV